MNQADQKTLVELLKNLEPGFLPYEIFVQIARLVVMPIIEFVPLRVKDNVVEVLLLDRLKSDNIWPGEIHTPGTVVRATDNEGEIYKAFERILKDELGSVRASDGHFVGTILHKSKRGMEHAQVFWIEVYDEPTIGKFYRYDDLPINLIESQKKFISLAVENFINSGR